ncbi:MAG: ABC transporter ATP-binding protein [Planctomycetia bacterium]|nr:ABC transporter ATP-binding protein [Planctomycetia bacterium]
MNPAASISSVTFRYGERTALDDVSFEVAEGEIFALVGPNGGGKTTLFRLLCTLVPVQQGEISILGESVRTRAAAVRQKIGVVFQAPSVDKKLSVAENLAHQGHLYGLAGRELKGRRDALLAQLGLADRAGDRAEMLSGGLRRRLEIAKGLLHGPRLLLMDEPSTGLDPAVRADLWRYLETVRGEGVTVLLTTHFLDEAEKAGRIAILSAGRLVALDTPDNLRAQVGGDSITIEASNPAALCEQVRARFSVPAAVVDGSVRVQHATAHRLLPQIAEAFAGQVRSITLGKPSLEDVFIARTGHRFWSASNETVGNGQRAKEGRHG